MRKTTALRAVRNALMPSRLAPKSTKARRSDAPHPRNANRRVKVGAGSPLHAEALPEQRRRTVVYR